MTVASKDIRHIFERLREGMVPERGLHAFAVGIDIPMGEINRMLTLVSENEGGSKFLRGDYGCGKTFISQLTMIEAINRNYAVSKVVVSPNDTHFHKFDEVYARIVGNLQTSMAKGGGSLGDCIDRWIAKIEDRLISEGEDEGRYDFDNMVKQRFDQELADLVQEEAGPDFIAVIREYFRLKQEGNIPSAMQLLAWLSGSKNIAAAVKKSAGVKGEISSSSALTYLKGILLIIKKAGHPGLVVVVDEVETILRMRSDIREKSLNGIRQILDATPDFKGIFWLFTGTPDFYDNRKGVAGLPPLHDRIFFRKSGDFVNIKQPQLELKPFDRARLIEVSVRLRELYPSENKNRILHHVSDDFITGLVDQITRGFGGVVGIIPRQYLRELVDVFDLIDQHEDYDPAKEYKIKIRDMSPEEEAAAGLNKKDDSNNKNDVEDIEF